MILHLMLEHVPLWKYALNALSITLELLRRYKAKLIQLQQMRIMAPMQVTNTFQKKKEKKTTRAGLDFNLNLQLLFDFQGKST